MNRKMTRFRQKIGEVWHTVAVDYADSVDGLIWDVPLPDIRYAIRCTTRAALRGFVLC